MHTTDNQASIQVSFSVDASDSCLNGLLMVSTSHYKSKLQSCPGSIIILFYCVDINVRVLQYYEIYSYQCYTCLPLPTAYFIIINHNEYDVN